MGKHVALIFLIVAALVRIAAGQTNPCMLVYGIQAEKIDNRCSGAGANTFCAASIYKGITYGMTWADGISDSVYLQASGRSDCAYTCNPGNVVGAPYKHKECWPIFYTPVKSPGYFSATAANVTTYPILDPFTCASKGISIPYVADIGCTGPQGSAIRVEKTHACNFSTDVDKDGYIGTAFGGDDCNDYAAFIHPGATPYCYSFVDFNCNGIPDVSEPYCSSPVLIDLQGDGIRLTDKSDGILFDLDLDGAREQLSWTAAGVDDAWLTLDRNGNGVVDDGTELFGSTTAQPDPPHGEVQNGFLALAVFDRAENGGNEDGVIDAGDRIYRDLRLWQDVNHNGVSEPDELHALESLAIAGIGLDYKLSKKVDEFGNQFRYRAKIEAKGSNAAKWTWDVLLIR